MCFFINTSGYLKYKHSFLIRYGILINMNKMYKKGLVWCRRDYRLQDHHALFLAGQHCENVVVCFIFDTNILSHLDTTDQRIAFIIESLRELDDDLRGMGSKLVIRVGDPIEKCTEIITQFGIDALYFNRDYEPYALTRDQKIHNSVSIPVHTCKDSVIFEKDEVLTQKGAYYTVFTPYTNKWLSLLGKLPTFSTPTNFLPISEESSIHENRWFDLLGFDKKHPFLPGGRSHALRSLNQFTQWLNAYDEHRDFPHLNRTSNLSVYLRFGCVSIREMVKFCSPAKSKGAMIWLSELIWRDFYQMICHTHPNCNTKAIKPEYDRIQWLGSSEDFEAWCNGQTGYPIVDAAMRQLNTTGMMHNRCRMIVASFLCKTLLVDWRKGEAYFAKKLLDFDFASNNGGWAWASSSGCDAQPYFRIFNPYTQSQKFDSNGDYIRQYCTELSTIAAPLIHQPAELPGYPTPIVDYAINRQRALDMYAVVKQKV